MAKNEPKPNIVKRAVKTVTKHVNVREASRTLDKIVDEEAPRDDRKADTSVVAPSPMGGAGCPLRLAQMAGFAGVVTATLAAAPVGRCGR